jgi:HAD superfamily phosphatase (TIGR01668 family)
MFLYKKVIINTWWRYYMFEKFVPDIYQKNVYTINYEKLKKKGIKCLLFDLDNTIIPTTVNKPDKKIKKLFYDLKVMGFKIIIVTNCPKIRVESFKNELQVDCAAFALKPRKDKFLKIMKMYNYKPSELVLIGDQLVNDVYDLSDFKENELIDMLDNRFRKAIQLEYNKDLEYGYKHICELSGGLDSRMSLWIATELGFSDITAITYCKSGYLDQQIAEQIESVSGFL